MDELSILFTTMDEKQDTLDDMDGDIELDEDEVQNICLRHN